MSHGNMAFIVVNVDTKHAHNFLILIHNMANFETGIHMAHHFQKNVTMCLHDQPVFSINRKHIAKFLRTCFQNSLDSSKDIK